MRPYTAVSTTKNSRRWGPEGREYRVASYIQRNEIPGWNEPMKSSCPTPAFCSSGEANVVCPKSTVWEVREAWNGISVPALAISAYSATTVLANRLYFLCQFWLIGGDCLELGFEDSVPCLGLLERSVVIRQRLLQRAGGGEWSAVALPHSCRPLQFCVLKSQPSSPPHTFSTGVHEDFLFPNVLNQRRGYLVRRKLAFRKIIQVTYPRELGC